VTASVNHLAFLEAVEFCNRLGYCLGTVLQNHLCSSDIRWSGIGDFFKGDVKTPMQMVMRTEEEMVLRRQGPWPCRHAVEAHVL
jgi:hypothetical protein